MRMIWATRGRSWGFRFLDDGGLADPLPEYERAFAAVAAEPEVHARVAAGVAVRFSDPEGRCDAAGRVIPHSFVIFGSDAAPLTSLEDARALLWPLVATAYGHRYDQPDPGPLGGGQRGAPAGPMHAE